MKAIEIKQRLEYLRGEIVKERISYGEIAELQSLVEHIDSGDVLLLEWAGVPENSGLYYHTTTEMVEFPLRNRILYGIGCYKNGDIVELKTGDAIISYHKLVKGIWTQIVKP